MNSRRQVLGGILLATFALAGGALAGSALTGCQSAPVVGSAPLATGQLGVEAIATDEYFAYWTLASGEVRRVSLDGGKVETLATGRPGPSSIALDATYVYWTAGDGTVARVAKEGGAVSVIAVAVDVRDITVDDTNVYFIAGSSVLAVAKDGSVSTPPTTLASSQVNPRSLSIQGGLLWASEGNTKMEDGGVSQVSLKTGAAVAPVALVSQISPHVLAIAAHHLAWTEVAQGRVRVAAIDGTGLADLATIDPTLPTDRVGKPEVLEAIVADDQLAYFTTNQGIVRSVSLTPGSTPEVLVQGAVGSVKLALDATTLYVANAGDGAILALPR